MSGSKSDDDPRDQTEFLKEVPREPWNLLTWEEVKDLGFDEAPESMGPADDEEASDE